MGGVFLWAKYPCRAYFGMAADAPLNPHKGSRDVDIRLCGKVNSKSHGARPVNQIISMMKWIRISRLPTRNSLPPHGVEISGERAADGSKVRCQGFWGCSGGAARAEDAQGTPTPSRDTSYITRYSTIRRFCDARYTCGVGIGGSRSRI